MKKLTTICVVVLVNWNDCQFELGDEARNFYQRMTSEKNLKDDSKQYYPVDVEGSARDYFRDDSMGVFDPTFDVVGPVTIDYSCKYPSPKDDDFYLEYRKRTGWDRFLPGEGLVVWRAETSDATVWQTNMVNTIAAERRPTDGATYNLAGQRVDSRYKGLVIKNGKVVVVKR